MNNYLYHYLSKFILLFMLALALSGCGGGGDPASQQNPPVDDPAPVPNIPASQSIAGGGIKGPLADAAVTIFAFDATKPGFKGAIVATASTDASAAITGLNLPLPSNPPYVMEFTSVPGVTTDITTGMAPVITALRTVITRSQLDSGEDIYATTLTTLAVDIAVLNAVDSNGIAGIQADEFEAALALSAKKVVSTLGFGLDRSVDIFSTPPLINRATVSAAQQTDVAAYRAAVEAVAAIVYQIAQQSGSVTADAVLGDLAADIADNDSIDGSSGGTLNVNTLQVLQQDPASLIIPDTSPVQTVADVHSILDAEKVITGSTTDTSRLLDGTIITQLEPVRTDVDSDGDGVINVEDDLPENKDESVDSDGDGIGDNTDPDDDNDGILDVDEGQVPSPTVNDTDGDGFDDGVDNCPADFNPSQTDTNADLEGDACDPDDDGDGVNDTEDAFPHDATRTIDTDSDGEDDSTDTDDDNDGLPDDLDTGLGQDGSTSCSLLIDCDGDGVLDGADADHTDANIGIRFAPVANDDSATVNEGQSVIIDLVVNDTIAGAGNSGVVASSSGGSVMIDPASIVIITQPVNGALVVNADGTVDYTHDASETVTDSFSYTIRDTGGLVSNVAGVNITVAPVNDVPVANDDSAMVDEGQSVNIDLAVNDTDVDNALDLGSISIVQAPSNGSLVVNVNGTVDYTHDGSETLVDSFSYSIRDVSGAVSGVANVSLVINPLNNAPVANADSASTNEGQGVNLNLVLNDTDVDSAIDVSSIVIVSAVSNGLLTVNANGTVDYIHDGSETLTDSFSYTIRDVSGALSNTAVVNITIIPVNDAPVAGADTASLNEGQSVNIDLAANDTDVDDALDLGSIAISSAPSNGLLVINANGTVDYTHDGSKTVSDSFSYTIRDASGAVSNTAIVTLNITLQNDVPVANIDSASVNEGQSVNIDLAANDTDTEGPVDLTSIVISSMPTNGSVAVNVNGTVDYTHDGSETLADNFSYTIRDADGAVSNVAAVSLAINPQNDAPVANNDSGGVNEGQVVILDLVANDTDADNAIDLASINIVSAPVNGSLVVNADGTVSYTHNGSGTLSDSFTYTIRDVSAAVSNVATVNLIITAQNDAPVANADAGSVNEGQSVNIDLAANDTDVDNAIDLGSITIVAAPVNGALVINANGTVDYTHDGSETLADSFSYTIRDISAAVSNIAMVNLAVNPQNDVPVANADTGNVNEGQSVNINLAANDTDVDSALDLGSIVITSAPINGSVVVNANGSVDYTHDGSETLVDSFSYSIRDTSGAISNIANVSLGITPLNTPPLANADSGSVNEGQSTRIDLAVNDTDVDNALDLGSIIITSGPVNGSVVVNADGTVDYTHDGSETLADNFSYTIRDALGAVSNVAAVSISVNAVNDAPIANADSASVDEGQSVNIDLAANDTDVEGPVDLSSVTIVLAPTRGVLVVNANGTVDYTHDGSETLSDSFSYTIRDGSGAVSNTASVSITVNAVNDAPVANSDNASVNEGQSVNINLVANDTDAENALDLSSITIVVTPANGALVINANGTVGYTHDGSATIADSFTYTIRDTSGAVSNIATVDITITPQNDAPVANADNANVNEAQSVNINLAANDTDIDNAIDLASITIVSMPVNGSLVVNANGSVDYTHDGSETLADSFTYTIRDALGAISNTAVVNISVNAINDVPVANADNGSVNEGQSVNLDLAANDTDADNALDLGSIVITSFPSNGSVVVNVNGSVDYTHDGSETLTDSFSYTIRDASAAVSAAATVTLSVIPVNDAPLAAADTGSVNEGQSININLAANDVDVDSAIDLTSITIIVAPSNGVLVVNVNGSVAYTHDGSETLSDSFSYTIRDTSGAVSNTATVNLTVVPQNDAPVANADSGNVNEGQSLNLNLAANDTDAEGSVDLTSIVISSAPSNGSVVVNINGTVDYTHDGSETLTDSFTYTIRDAAGATSNVATVSLDIVPQNDAPVANADSASVDEGQSVVINLTANDTDAEGPVDVTSIVITSPPVNGSLVVNANGTVDYTHDGSETLTDSFAYTVKDASVAVSNTATVSLSVNAINDAPVAGADNGIVNEGQSISLNLAANDSDVDNALDLTSITIVAAPGNGSVIVNGNGTVDYTHDGSETLVDSFTYTIRDISAAVSNTATVNLTVVPQNDAPVANADSGNVNEGQSISLNLAANDSDVDNALDLTSITIVAAPGNGSVVINANGTVDYTHDGSETLVDSFSYTIRDASAAVSNIATVSLTVNPQNDAPVANADSASVNEGQSININLALNDTDVDNALDLSSIVISSAPANGSVIVNANGSVDYTHDGSETLADSFTYTIRDASGASSQVAVVSLSIIAVNDAPVANADSGNVNEGQSLNLNLAANDSDVDNALDLASITIVAAPGNGSVVINANGTVDYTHDGSETLVDSFSYTIRDVSAAVSNIATVSLTVNPQNDAPVANADSASVNEGQSININLALNDTDVDNALDLTSIVISSAPANGSVIVNANGSVDYTHDGSETLVDSFSYTIRDASGASSQVAVVSLSIIAVNDAPVANADSGNVNEGQSISLNLAANDSDVDNALDLASITIVAAPGNGSVVINANGTVDYTHDGSETLVDSFSYTIRDASAAVSNIETVSLTVNPQNDAPVANVDNGNVNEGQSINLDLAANDTDVDNALDLTSITIVAAPANGALIVNANGSVDYTHDGSETLVDSFSYTIRDASAAVSNIATVSLTINPQNDAPVANADSASVDEGLSVNINLALNDTDAENALDLASMTIVTAPANGSVIVNANGTVDYTHDGSETLADSFSYTIRDTSAAVSQVATVTLTIVPVNDPPVGNVDSFTVDATTATVLDVLANDTDVDGGVLSISNVSQGSKGSTVTHDGSTITFTDVNN
ncbi:MAG TPA: tandem-95 repeat protein, partial [Gammaproteobacteria bacterium]|nr:tandem-95 repeat protein [Gammaproteobacteria bacterium]